MQVEWKATLHKRQVDKSFTLRKFWLAGEIGIFLMREVSCACIRVAASAWTAPCMSMGNLDIAKQPTFDCYMSPG